MRHAELAWAHRQDDARRLGEIGAEVSRLVSGNRKTAQMLRQTHSDFMNGKNQIGVPDLLRAMIAAADAIEP